MHTPLGLSHGVGWDHMHTPNIRMGSWGRMGPHARNTLACDCVCVSP